jgi:hypothetical protein
MTHTNPDPHGSDDASQDNEEPALTQEESVPTDGKDVDGEELMKSVRNEQLKEPPPPV